MRYVKPGTIAIATVLLVAPTLVQAAHDPATDVEGERVPLPGLRMVGGPGALRVGIMDAVAVGGDLAYLGTRGKERVGLRWVDGVSGQDRRLAAVGSGDFSHHVAALGQTVVFSGSNRKSVEPWRSDGTRAGTRMLKDVASGRTRDACVPGPKPGVCGTHPAGSFPRPFVAAGDVAYFSAYDSRRGRELWRTDGTSAGTRLLKDIGPDKKSGIQDIGLVLSVDGDELYFVANDGRHGSELWRSDGTRARTRMVTDIGPGWSVPWWEAPVVAGDRVYFAARTQDTGLELWRSDGTPEGTVLVKDIRPGPRPSKPEDLVVVGDRLFFTAIDGGHGRELWQTDGSAAGTTLVKDITPGDGGSFLDDFAVLADSLYFSVGGGQRTVQYRSDGTEAGTQPFGLEGSILPGLRRKRSESPSTVTIRRRLFFTADDEVHGAELWSTDGTPAGTELVYDLRPGVKGSNPEWLVAAGDYLYFTASDGEHGRQLWQLPVAEA